MEISPRHPILGGNEVKGNAGIAEIRDPFDASLVGLVGLADRTQASQAIGQASNAFRSFRLMSAHQRSEILAKTSGLINARKEELAILITREAGKPLTASRLEVDRAVFTFKSAAEAVTYAHNGEVLDMTVTESGVGRAGSYRYFPIGVLLAITPFNYPLNLVAHKLAPAIAAGNTVVLKPAPQTPLTSFLLADILHQAGLPSGALNVVTCENDVAESMVRDERIAMVSFTGSDAVGWKLKAIAGRAKVALELGGNGYVIVHDVEDPASIVEVLAKGAFGFAGQICISLQNLLVRRDLYDDMLRRMTDVASQISPGDPKLETTLLGPMISGASAQKVEGWIADAVARGAERHTGVLQAQNTITPTLLTGVPHDSKLYQNEAFAPILIMQPYDTIEDAIEIVNSSRYGLQAGLFTNDVRVITRAYEELEVGGLIVNDTNAFRLDTMPYGGVKSSGFGREGIIFAMREMSEVKMLVTKA